MALFGNKKGQIENYLIVVVALFVLALSYFIGLLVLTNFTTEFTNAGFCPPGSVCEETANDFIASLTIWDNLILLVMVGLFIAVGLTSYKLPADAAFFILSILLAPFLGYVSYFFNYVFIEIVSNTAFDSVRAYYPKTIIIVTNLHWIALIAFVIGSITLYAKRPRGQFIP